jgi:hypothetical protein
MPNWCNNSITITGPKEKVSAIWAGADQEPGILGRMRPEPKYETEEGWYGWRVHNWGTKWDITNEGLGYEESGDSGTITGWFDSAWSPPVEAVKYYCQENPDVEIYLTYHEPGMCFVGEWRHDAGDEDETLDEYFEYQGCTSDDVRKFIGARLDDEWNVSEMLADYEEDEGIETLGSGMEDEEGRDE